MEDGENKRKRRRRRRRAAKKDSEDKKSFGKKPWIIAGSIVGGLLVIYLGISAFFIGHFFINTTINGKDFSGRSVADVEEYLKEERLGEESRAQLLERKKRLEGVLGDETE